MFVAVLAGNNDTSNQTSSSGGKCIYHLFYCPFPRHHTLLRDSIKTWHNEPQREQWVNLDATTPHQE